MGELRRILDDLRHEPARLEGGGEQGGSPIAGGGAAHPRTRRHQLTHGPLHALGVHALRQQHLDRRRREAPGSRRRSPTRGDAEGHGGGERQRDAKAKKGPAALA